MAGSAELVELQRAAGAVFGESQAGAPPVSYGNPHGEYAVATSEAALIDCTDRIHIVLRGADRADFLHNFCTNDIRALKPGEGCEAFVTNIQGKVLGHIFARFCIGK